MLIIPRVIFSDVGFEENIGWLRELDQMARQVEAAALIASMPSKTLAFEPGWAISERTSRVQVRRLYSSLANALEEQRKPFPYHKGCDILAELGVCGACAIYFSPADYYKAVCQIARGVPEHPAERAHIEKMLHYFEVKHA